jgi:hypothetical protein
MTAPKALTLLHTLAVGNVQFPVYRATPDEVPELLDGGAVLDGYVDFERCCIYVREGQSETQERDTIMHEAVHAFLSVTGLKHLLKGAVKKKIDFEEFEELFVRIATPHLVAVASELRKVA